jgi:hypothetical protein
MQNGVMNSANKFVYASSKFPAVNSNFWSWERASSSTWPPQGVTDTKLYFYPGNQLWVTPYTGATSSVSFVNDVIDTSVNMEYLVNTEFRGPLFDAKFHKSELNFETPALLQDCKMAGNINVDLFYSSAADLCQYNFQVWEVKANNEAKLVTRANYTDRSYTPNVSKEKYFPGQSYSHVFKAGSRIRVTATNLDNVPLFAASGDTVDTFLRTNPFVLPVLKRGENKILINGSNKSYIQLPLQNFAIGIQNISNEIPRGFNLSQNYPNPFNPTTKIKFDIPAHNSGPVILKVYDARGSEVATLVNEPNLPAGTYEADWNAAGFSSGVYFYRLISGEYSEVKKMILVK